MNPRAGMMLRESLSRPRYRDENGRFLPERLAPRCAYCGDDARTRSGVPFTCLAHPDLPNLDPNYGGGLA